MALLANQAAGVRGGAASTGGAAGTSALGFMGSGRFGFGDWSNGLPPVAPNDRRRSIRRASALGCNDDDLKPHGTRGKYRENPDRPARSARRPLRWRH